LFTVQRQIRGLVIAFCWQLSGAIAGAQQVPSATPKSSPESSAIPLSKIASEAESTLRTVQSIETTISTDQITATVEKNLPRLTTEIELRGAEMAKFLGGVVPVEFCTAWRSFCIGIANGSSAGTLI
jgi:hypothetical protein